MEDNNKLFVFDKKEVVLIFVFIVVIAVTAFTLGVRIGKQLSLKEDGYAKEDIEALNLKSVEEEYVEDIVSGDGEGSDNAQGFEGALEKNGAEAEAREPVADVEARLREEMKKLARGETGTEASGGSLEATGESAVEGGEQDIQSEEDLYSPGKEVKGKFTIQLYANQSKAAAQDFADAFIVKGYDVIINEAEIPGKGVWYRVSIGVFDTIARAKEYLDKEKSLFQGEDYIIQQL